MKRGLLLLMIVLAVPVTFGQLVDTTRPWHYMQQIAKGPSGPGSFPYNMTSIDNNSDGVLDLTEYAMDCDKLDGMNSSVFIGLAAAGGFWRGGPDIWYNLGGVSIGTNDTPTHDLVVSGDVNITKDMVVGGAINTTGALYVGLQGVFYSNLAVLGFLSASSSISTSSDLFALGDMTSTTVHTVNATIYHTLNTTNFICTDCIDLGPETQGILPPSEGGTGSNSLDGLRANINASIKMNSSCPIGQSLRFIDSDTYICGGSSYMMTSENGTLNAVYVNNDSNVGIGITDAAYKLEVSGDTFLDGDVIIKKDLDLNESLKVLKNISVKGTSNFNGLVAVNGTDPRTALDVFGFIFSRGICDIGGSNCVSARYIRSLEVINISLVTHDGDFHPFGGGTHGSQSMYQWVQVNGCPGQHVCTESEIFEFIQTNTMPVIPAGGAWYNGGFGNDRCGNWEYNDAVHKGSVFYANFTRGNEPCNTARHVLCCS